MVYTPGLWLFILATIIISGLIFYSWQFRRMAVGRAFLLLMSCALIWTAGFSLETAAISLELKLFFARLQFLTITYLPVAWLSLVFAYTGQAQPLRIRLLLLAVPTLTNVVIWTNPLHHWFYGTPRIDLTSAPFPVLYPDYQFWFYAVHAPAGYILLLSAIAVLAHALLKMEPVYRTQGWLLLVSILLPAITDLMYVLGFSPVPHYNYTTAVFSISGLILAWALFRHHFLDLIPLARSIVFANMSDSILVFDYKNRIIDANPAAQTLFGLSKKAVGLSIQETNHDSLRQLENLYLQKEFTKDIEFGTHPGYHYDLRISLIEDQKGVQSGWVVTLRDITERMALFTRMQTMATQDSLTGIANRRSFFERCNHELLRVQRQPENSFAILMIDLDYFKSINDSFGHNTGDQVLVAFTQKIKAQLRATDIFGRLGGEEFAILLTEVDPDETLQIAERLCKSTHSIHLPDQAQAIKITASIGAVCSQQLEIGGLVIESILSLADQALYQAKQTRDRVVLFRNEHPEPVGLS